VHIITQYFTFCIFYWIILIIQYKPNIIFNIELIFIIIKFILKLLITVDKPYKEAKGFLHLRGIFHDYVLDENMVGKLNFLDQKKLSHLGEFFITD